MFDPTLYENLKAVLEGAVYELDRHGRIVVVHRSDLIDLAAMSRSYAIGYRLVDGRCSADIRLMAGLVDLAGEKLEWRNAQPGSKLELFFSILVRNPVTACKNIQDVLTQIWDSTVSITQTLSFRYGDDGSRCHNRIGIHFERKWSEGHGSEIARLLEQTVRTLRLLEPYNMEE
ncbi:MAG: hypothetical protein K0Q59_1017 [Paenibacillus sp.]|jgi:hypothetical protein|nr:hypothetical protein [Paenibacillus sp.]